MHRRFSAAACALERLCALLMIWAEAAMLEALDAYRRTPVVRTSTDGNTIYFVSAAGEHPQQTRSDRLSVLNAILPLPKN
jgi:hypothetical protein